jgi:hypothetical protein
VKTIVIVLLTLVTWWLFRMAWRWGMARWDQDSNVGWIAFIGAWVFMCLDVLVALL